MYLCGSIYVASAESGDDSIHNMSRPKTKKIFFSFLFYEEKKFNLFFLLLTFTRRNKLFFSNKNCSP